MNIREPSFLQEGAKTIENLSSAIDFLDTIKRKIAAVINDPNLELKPSEIELLKTTIKQIDNKLVQAQIVLEESFEKTRTEKELSDLRIKMITQIKMLYQKLIFEEKDKLKIVIDQSTINAAIERGKDNVKERRGKGLLGKLSNFSLSSSESNKWAEQNKPQNQGDFGYTIGPPTNNKQ